MKPKHKCKMCGFATNNLMDVVSYTGLQNEIWLCPMCAKKMMSEMADTMKLSHNTWLYMPQERPYDESVMFHYHERLYPCFGKSNWGMWAKGRVARRP